MKKIIRIAAVTAAVAGFAVPGFAAAQTANVSTLGPNSGAHVDVRNHVRNSMDTTNNLRARATNTQSAYTGDADAGNNTSVGDVGTGTAMVDNMSDVTARIDNSGAGGDCGCMGTSEVSADVSTAGPNSPAYVDVHNDVQNTMSTVNTVDISTSNRQTAESGNASAYNNTTVGNVTTGDASATNTTTVELDITN